jgi:hypothetical protein
MARKMKGPLVPIEGARLKRSRSLNGWSVRGLTEELRKHGVRAAWQTLTYVERGSQRSVRLDLFESLVALLRGPHPAHEFRAWLRGDPTELGPAAAAAEELKQVGRRRLAAPQRLLAPLAFDVTMRDAVELRDRAVHDQPRRAQSEAWHEITVAGRVQRFYSPDTWRRALFVGAPEQATPDERDAAAEHLSKFLRIIAAPWLSGRARLRPDAARRAIELLDQFTNPTPSTPRRRGPRS